MLGKEASCTCGLGISPPSYSQGDCYRPEPYSRKFSFQLFPPRSMIADHHVSPGTNGLREGKGGPGIPEDPKARCGSMIRPRVGS